MIQSGEYRTVNAGDVLEGIVPRFARVILDDIITPVRLVDVDLALYGRGDHQYMRMIAAKSPRSRCISKAHMVGW